jgi:hypothetical protein
MIDVVISFPPFASSPTEKLAWSRFQYSEARISRPATTNLGDKEREKEYDAGSNAALAMHEERVY